MAIKASPAFVAILVEGIKALRSKYGQKSLDLKPWTIYFMVHDSCTPGFEHNAKVQMTKTDALHNEAKGLTDDNIAAAVRAAFKEVA